LSVVREFLAGKTPVVDSAFLIHSAKALASVRDKLESEDSRWKELDTQVHDVLTRAIEMTSDSAVLSEAYSIATWLHLDIQISAARKAIRLTKVPTPAMYSNLARSLYLATDANGPSPALSEAEQAAARASALSRSSADLTLLGDIQRQAEKFRE